MPLPATPLLVTGALAALVWLTGRKADQGTAPDRGEPLPGPNPVPRPNEPDPPLPEQQYDSAAIIGDGVRLRAAPNTTGAILATLPKGTIVSLVDAPFAPQNAGEQYPWWQIAIPGGQRGWSYSQFISLSRGAVPKDEEEKNRREAERERPIFQGAPPGWQGAPPGWQGAPPGWQGRPPVFSGDEVAFGASPPFARHSLPRRSFARQSFPRFSPRVFPVAVPVSMPGFGWYSPPSPPSTPEEAAVQCTPGAHYARCVSANGCWLHETPDPKSRILSVASSGAVVRVLRNLPGWSLVRYLDPTTKRSVDAWAVTAGFART